MAEIAGLAGVLGSLFVNLVSRYDSLKEWIEGRGDVPVQEYIDDGRPRAIIVRAKHNPADDIKLAGYNIILEIGQSKELSPAEMTRWAEGAAAVIAKTKQGSGGRPLHIVFSGPVALAFTIGTLLGHSNEYRTLHWDGNQYVLLDAPDMGTFRRAL